MQCLMVVGTVGNCVPALISQFPGFRVVKRTNCDEQRYELSEFMFRTSIRVIADITRRLTGC